MVPEPSRLQGLSLRYHQFPQRSQVQHVRDGSHLPLMYGSFAPSSRACTTRGPHTQAPDRSPKIPSPACASCRTPVSASRHAHHASTTAGVSSADGEADPSDPKTATLFSSAPPTANR